MRTGELHLATVCICVNLHVRCRADVADDLAGGVRSFDWTTAVSRQRVERIASRSSGDNLFKRFTESWALVLFWLD